MEEINARGIAELDQAMAASKGMAAFISTYFRHLTEQGFTREEALEIILGYQDWLLTHGGKAKP
jgi:hypothetical protein